MESSAKIIPSGAIVVAMYGGYKQIGRTGMLAAESSINQALTAIIPKKDKLTSKYLLYWLNHNIYLWRRFAASSRKDPNITKSDVTAFPVCLPPLPEQKKIAQILSTWDRAIDQLQSLIKAKTRRKHGLMQQLLTGKKRLPGYEGTWHDHKLSDLLEHTFRPVDWKPEDIYDLISIRRRSNGIVRREKIAGKDYKTRDLHVIKSGDFLISKRQVSHGALAMVTPEFEGCHVSKEYTILTNQASDKLHMPYLGWLSRTSRFWWLTFVASNGVVKEKLIFAPKDFLKFTLKFPPTLKEQKAIAKVLDTTTREIATHQKQLDTIREQKRGLMQKLLTGEIRVKTT